MIQLETNNLDELVTSGLHLVDFYADWCGPCKMLSQVLEKMQTKVSIIKVDMDKFPDLAMAHGVMSVPTIHIYKNGRVVEELIGFRTEEELLEIIRNIP